MNTRRPRRYQPRYLWLFAKAAVLASVNAALFASLPYRRITPRLGRCVSVGEAEVAAVVPTPEQIAIAGDVKWVMGAILRRAPFRIWCVPQALTAKALLGDRAPWVVFVGHERGRTVSEGMTKHVWLLCGPVRVTGYPEALSHEPIAGYLPTGGRP